MASGPLSTYSAQNHNLGWNMSSDDCAELLRTSLLRSSPGPDSSSCLAPSLLLSCLLLQPSSSPLTLHPTPSISLSFSSLLVPPTPPHPPRSTPSPFTPTPLCQSLRAVLPARCRRSSVRLRFSRWTHSTLSPFPPRRAPRWLRSPFPG